jgi:hypothetical protein
LNRYGGITTFVNNLDVGTKFYVCNGAWYGEIVLKDGKKFVLVEGDSLENAMEVTNDNILDIKIIKSKGD